MKASQDTSAAKLSQRRIPWICALGVSFLLSVFAALRGGYVGPDYHTHLPRLLEWQRIFDFSTTNPPTYYLFGHGLFLFVGRNNAFPISLSIVQAAVNTLAVWSFFRYMQYRFESRVIHLALVFFLTFLPVRIIHATTIGTDWATIPLFVLLLFLFDRFLSDASPTRKNAALLGLALTLAIGTKYSFMVFLPAALAVFICLWRNSEWSFKRFVAICLLALMLPSVLSLYSFWASSRVHGYNTQKHWLATGMVPDMDYKDLFLVKAADIELFEAPEYFKRDKSEIANGSPYYAGYRAPHKHSYLALSHLGVFTDTMNLFQILPVPQSVDTFLIPDQKSRVPWKTRVMQASMSLGAIWTLLALIGTPWLLFRALKNLRTNKFGREDIVAFFGTAYFLLMFLPIPFVSNGALYGYWTPRLILPALFYFFTAAFLLIDRKIATRSKKIAFAVLALVTIQSAIEIVMLA